MSDFFKEKQMVRYRLWEEDSRMKEDSRVNKKESSEEYITEDERKQLLSALHCRLFWVGQHIPDHVEIEGKTFPLPN